MPKDRSEASEDQGHGALAFPAADWRCTWETHGRRCYLAGDISPDIGDRARRYCHWHYVIRAMPALQDNFAEFERWRAIWSGYCSLENHHPAPEVWAAVRGEAPIQSTPKGCGHFRCPHPGNVVRTAPPFDAAAVRQEVAALETRLSVQNRPRDLEAEKRAVLALVPGPLDELP